MLFSRRLTELVRVLIWSTVRRGTSVRSKVSAARPAKTTSRSEKSQVGYVGPVGIRTYSQPIAGAVKCIYTYNIHYTKKAVAIRPAVVPDGYRIQNVLVVNHTVIILQRNYLQQNVQRRIYFTGCHQILNRHQSASIGINQSASIGDWRWLTPIEVNNQSASIGDWYILFR